MDNFKVGFSQNFGSQLGMGQSKLGAANNDTLSNRGGQTFGAVGQPKVAGDASFGQAMNNDNNVLENSLRQSNILSTPSSKGGKDDDMN